MTSQRGFTLVEVLAALVILGLTLGLCYRLLGQGVGMVGATTTRAQALALAEGQLAALMTAGTVAPGQFGGEAGAMRWQVDIVRRTDGPFQATSSAGITALSITVTAFDGRGVPVQLTSTRLARGAP